MLNSALKIGADMDMLSIRFREVALSLAALVAVFGRDINKDISASMMGADILNSDSKIGADMDMLFIRRREVALSFRALVITGIDISASMIGADMLNSASKIGTE